MDMLLGGNTQNSKKNGNEPINAAPSTQNKKL
jgi:hypothetical protein